MNAKKTRQKSKNAKAKKPQPNSQNKDGQPAIQTKKSQKELEAEKLQKELETLLKDIRDFVGNDKYIFRGENKKYDKISSKLYRYFQTIASQAILQEIVPEPNLDLINKALKKQLSQFAQDIDFAVLKKALKENIISQLAQKGGHFLMVEDIQKNFILKDVQEHVDFENEIDTLAELQHYGGSTNRIDFSYDLAVALFFTCDGEPEENGRLILLRADDEGVIAPKKNQNNRIVFQKSVFVKRDKGYIEEKDIKKFTVSKNIKSLVLAYVQNYFGIRTGTIYGDLMGYIQNQERHSEAYKYFVVGLFYYHEEEAEKAAGYFKKAIELKPNFFEAHNNLGNAKVMLNPPDFKGAIIDYDKALELNPDFAEGYFNRGVTYDRLTPPNLKKAIADYDKAIALKPEYVEVYSKRGVAYGKEGKHDLAIADFGKAIEIYPNDASAYSNRGNVYKNKGDYDLAVTDYNKAIEIDPNYATAYNNRGSAYESKGDYDLAIAGFSKAIEIDPNYTMAYNNRGIIYGKEGKYDLAIADYNKAIEIDPNDPAVHNNRGAAKTKITPPDLKGAIADYDKAIELHPNYAEAYYNRGVFYGVSGKLGRAITNYDRAIMLNTDYAEAYTNRGITKIALPDIKGAKEDLETALPLAEKQGRKDLAAAIQKAIDELPKESDS